MFNGFYDRSRRHCQWNDRNYFQVLTAQYPFEIDTLAAIYQHLAPKVVVEIGSQDGGTLLYWLKYGAPDTKIFSVDPSPNFDIRDERLRVLATRSDDEGTLKTLRDAGPIDFLFIDGDHGYDGVRYDFVTYGPMVRSGGVIALHDVATYREDCQVHKLWQEIREAGYVTQELRVAADQQPYGAGIGVVYP